MAKEFILSNSVFAFCIVSVVSAFKTSFYDVQNNFAVQFWEIRFLPNPFEVVRHSVLFSLKSRFENNQIT